MSIIEKHGLTPQEQGFLVMFSLIPWERYAIFFGPEKPQHDFSLRYQRRKLFASSNEELVEEWPGNRRWDDFHFHDLEFLAIHLKKVTSYIINMAQIGEIFWHCETKWPPIRFGIKSIIDCRDWSGRGTIGTTSLWFLQIWKRGTKPKMRHITRLWYTMVGHNMIIISWMY